VDESSRTAYQPREALAGPLSPQNIPLKLAGVRLTIPPSAAGQRLDIAVTGLTGLSRNQAKIAIQAGRVRLDGKRVAKGAAVQAGQDLVVTPGAALLAADPSVEIRVVAEDSQWLVIDKPAGVPVLPKDGSPRSLVTGLMATRTDEADWAQLTEDDHSAVHRLDTATSGCVLFAKNAASHEHLREHWGDFTKTYAAQVPKGFTDRGRLESRLVVAQHQPARVMVIENEIRESPSGSRLCHLSIESREASEDGDTLRIQLGTGFLHQIRVMLAARGAPIDGDTLYGGRSAPRLMLHAESLVAKQLGIQAQSPAPF